MNIDKGNQQSGGEDVVLLGDVAGSTPCGGTPRWELKQLSGGGEVSVTTDGSGSVWLFVGTDSGFESTTRLYFTWVVATLVPL